MTVLGLVTAALIMGFFYFSAFATNGLDDEGFHMSMAFVLLLVALHATAVIPATVICSEREAGTWPSLLGTTVGNTTIVRAKLLGSLRRVAPGWWLLLGHMGLFTFLGFLHPVGIVFVTMIVAQFVLLLAASGLYFSQRFSKTTTAVTCNMLLAVFLWMILPACLGILSGIIFRHEAEWILFFHPFVQFGCVIDGIVRDHWLQPLGGFNGPTFRGDVGAVSVFFWLLVSMAAYLSLASWFLLLTRVGLRRRIFRN